MQIEYSREYEKSFVKIRAKEAEWQEFEIQMMLNYKLDGLLPFYDVIEDGENVYLYEITGLQSLDVILQRKELSFSFLHQIFDSMHQLAGRMREHLLDMSGIVLKEDLIFVSNDGKQIYFIYLPRREASMEIAMTAWMEYLLTRINHSDLKCTQLAYLAYQQMLDGTFSLADVLAEPFMVEERIEEKGQQAYGETEVERYIAEENKYGADADFTEEVAEEKVEKRKKERSSFFREKIPFKKRLHQMQQEEETYEELQETTKIPIVRDPIGAVLHNQSVHPTVYLGAHTQDEVGWFLYQGIADEKDFFIEENELIIGKQQEQVDIVLRSESVSRIHARISHNEDGFYIEDMNTTNGTFVNEQQIPYREPVQIKKGDRVAFGDVRYSFY